MVVFHHCPDTLLLREGRHAWHIQRALTDLGHRAVGSLVFTMDARNAVAQALQKGQRIMARVRCPVNIYFYFHQLWIGGLQGRVIPGATIEICEFKIVVMIGKRQASLMAARTGGIQARSQRLYPLCAQDAQQDFIAEQYEGDWRDAKELLL